MDRKGELKELENLQISTADSGCENSSHTHPISDGVQLSTKLAASSVDIEVSTVSVDSWSEAPSPSICTTAASTNQLHFSFVTHMVDIHVDPHRLLQDIRSCGSSAHNLIIKKQGINETHVSQSGYGFVSFDSPQACQAAHAKLKGLIINGITYDCSMAKRTFSVSRPHAMLVSEQGSFRHAGTNDHAGGPYAPDHHQQVNNMQSHEHHQHHQYAHLAPHGYASSASLQQVNQHAPSPYGAPLDTCTQYQHPHPSASQYMIPPQQTPSYYVLAQHLPAQPQFAVRQLPGYAPQYMAPGGPAYVLNDTQQHHLQPAHQPAFHPASQQVFLNPGSLPHARTDQHQNQHQQHLYQQQQQQQQYHYEQLQLQLQHYKQQQHQQHQHHQQQQKQQAQYHYEQQQLQLQHQHAMQTLADSHQFQSPPLQQSYRGQCNDQSKVRLRQDNCRHSLGASTNSPSSTSSKKNPLHK